MKEFLLSTVLVFNMMAHGQCDAPQVIPYYEDFTDIIAPNLPSCTASGMQTFVGNHWITSPNPGRGFTGNVLYYNTFSDENWSMSATFSCRPVYLEAGVPYMISYKYSNDGTTGFNGLYTELISHGAGTTTSVGMHENITASEAVSYVSGVITVAATGSYTLLLTANALNRDSNLFVDDIAIEAWDAMNTKNVEAGAIAVYPNPVKDKLMIHGFSGVVAVYDTTGRLVAKENYDGNGINIQHLQNGLYNIVGNTANGTFRGKFIKE